jgi:hypothetical protein
MRKHLLLLLCVAFTSIISLLPNNAYSQTFDRLRYVGSGGVGFSNIEVSTQITSSKVVFLDSQSTLVFFDTKRSRFKQRRVDYFVQNPVNVYSMAYTSGAYSFLVQDHEVPTLARIVTLDTNLDLIRNIPLHGYEIDFDVNDMAYFSRKTVRIIAANNLLEINTRSGDVKIVTSLLPAQSRRYIFRDGKEYIGTQNSILRLERDGSLSTIVEDNNGIMSFTVDKETVDYFTSSSIDLVNLRDGKRTEYKYPNSNGFAYNAGELLYPYKTYKLENDQLLVHDNKSLATVASNFDFIDRFGAIDAPEERCKDAVNEKGDTAVGRVGYVSITQSNGTNKNVPIRTTLHADAVPTSLTFATNRYVLVSYVNYIPVLESGIILIDRQDSKVIRQKRIEVSSITDIDFNHNIYIAADGNLWMLDLFLKEPLELIPNIPAYELSSQGQNLYARTADRVTKFTPSNKILRSNMFQLTLGYINNKFGSYPSATHILPDESLLSEFLGYVDAAETLRETDDGLVVRQFFPVSIQSGIGNGKGNYFLTGYRQLELYQYSPKR